MEPTSNLCPKTHPEVVLFWSPARLQGSSASLPFLCAPGLAVTQGHPLNPLSVLFYVTLDGTDGFWNLGLLHLSTSSSRKDKNGESRHDPLRLDRNVSCFKRRMLNCLGMKCHDVYDILQNNLEKKRLLNPVKGVWEFPALFSLPF